MKEKSKPIRIAHIVGKWLGGGVEAVIMNYYRHIDREKVQFDFICDEDSNNIPYEEIENMGGRVILIPPYQKIFKYSKVLKGVLKKERYQIVHSHINTLSVFSLRIAKKAGVHVRIAHSHSTTNKKEVKKNILKQVLRPFSKVYATEYFACSELAGRWLFGNKAFDNKKVYVLNNAIDLEKFEFSKEKRKEKRNELNIQDDTLVIGHIGRFVAQKNHTFLIDVFAKVYEKNKNSVLLLVGQGPLKEDVEKKVNQLGLEKAVKFLGQRNDCNELYQVMDVFVLPSLYEGLPVVGVEAQAAGCKCIFSDDMTKETKILDNTEFFNLECKPEKLASNIIKTLQYRIGEREKINMISEKGFDIRKQAREIEKMYESKR